MVTRDEVREVLRTLPDDYLRRYVEAYEGKRLSCFPGNICHQCAVTVMAGVDHRWDGGYQFARDGLCTPGLLIEEFYEDFAAGTLIGGVNATPLYDECVMELARRAEHVPAEAAR